MSKKVLIAVVAVIVGVIAVALLLAVLGGVLWVGGPTSEDSGTVGASDVRLTT